MSDRKGKGQLKEGFKKLKKTFTKDKEEIEIPFEDDDPDPEREGTFRGSRPSTSYNSLPVDWRNVQRRISTSFHPMESPESRPPSPSSNSSDTTPRQSTFLPDFNPYRNASFAKSVGNLFGTLGRSQPTTTETQQQPASITASRSESHLQDLSVPLGLSRPPSRLLPPPPDEADLVMREAFPPIPAALLDFLQDHVMRALLRRGSDIPLLTYDQGQAIILECLFPRPDDSTIPVSGGAAGSAASSPDPPRIILSSLEEIAEPGTSSFDFDTHLSPSSEDDTSSRLEPHLESSDDDDLYYEEVPVVTSVEEAPHEEQQITPRMSSVSQFGDPGVSGSLSASTSAMDLDTMETLMTPPPATQDDGSPGPGLPSTSRLRWRNPVINPPLAADPPPLTESAPEIIPVRQPTINLIHQDVHTRLGIVLTLDQLSLSFPLPPPRDPNTMELLDPSGLTQPLQPVLPERHLSTLDDHDLVMGIPEDRGSSSGPVPSVPASNTSAGASGGGRQIRISASGHQSQRASSRPTPLATPRSLPSYRTPPARGFSFARSFLSTPMFPFNRTPNAAVDEQSSRLPATEPTIPPRTMDEITYRARSIGKLAHDVQEMRSLRDKGIHLTSPPTAKEKKAEDMDSPLIGGAVSEDVMFAHFAPSPPRRRLRTAVLPHYEFYQSPATTIASPRPSADDPDQANGFGDFPSRSLMDTMSSAQSQEEDPLARMGSLDTELPRHFEAEGPDESDPFRAGLLVAPIDSAVSSSSSRRTRQTSDDVFLQDAQVVFAAEDLLGSDNSFGDSDTSLSSLTSSLSPHPDSTRLPSPSPLPHSAADSSNLPSDQLGDRGEAMVPSLVPSETYSSFASSMLHSPDAPDPTTLSAESTFAATRKSDDTIRGVASATASPDVAPSGMYGPQRTTEAGSSDREKPLPGLPPSITLSEASFADVFGPLGRTSFVSPERPSRPLTSSTPLEDPASRSRPEEQEAREGGSSVSPPSTTPIPLSSPASGDNHYQPATSTLNSRQWGKRSRGRP